jgi:hypothetical protein
MSVLISSSQLTDIKRFDNSNPHYPLPTTYYLLLTTYYSILAAEGTRK